VIGQLLTQDPTVVPAPIRNDGLITIKGAAIPCSAGCPSDLVVETIAKTNVDAFGLCQSDVLFGVPFGCPSEEGVSNVPMAAIGFPGHPMWPKICLFLDSNAGVCKPRLTVALSDPKGGSVVASQIDCGQTCSASYPAGTFVVLTGIPNSAAFSFAGWSGDCAGSGSVRMDADKSCTAIFAPLPVQILSIQCSLTPEPQPPFRFPFLQTVKMQGVVTDSDIGAVLGFLFGPGLGSGVDCGQWTKEALDACIHNPGQPNTTQWSYTVAGFFPNPVEVVPNPFPATLFEPSGPAIGRAEAPFTCQ
jgi:hypothetical protein